MECLAGADSYELLVAASVSFTTPAIAKTGTNALPTTAWESDVNLDYDTTYYWKVRASGSSSYGVWSAVSAFTTRALSESALLSSSESSSSPLSPELVIPGWVKYVAIALLVTMVTALVTMIVLTLKVLRL